MKKNEIRKVKWYIKQCHRVCPRCGQAYEYIEIRKVNKNFYVYFVHDTVHSGKRRVRKCYSGALSNYIYVQRFQSEGLERLRGIHDPTRFFDYYIQLTKYFADILAYQSSSLSVQQLKVMKKRLEEVLYLLDVALSQTK